MLLTETRNNVPIVRNESDMDSPHFKTRQSKHVLCCSNHVMMNRTRVLNGQRPLTRSIVLDEIAHHHAVAMASSGEVYNSVQRIDELKVRLQTTKNNGAAVAENVHRGMSVRQIQDVIEFDTAFQKSLLNITSEEFSECGVGTAKGKDGKSILVPSI